MIQAVSAIYKELLMNNFVTTKLPTLYGVSQVTEIRNMTNAPDTVYIAKDAVSGIGPSTIMAADNYNGNNGALGTVYLELPEYVSGTVRVVSYVKGGGSPRS